MFFFSLSRIFASHWTIDEEDGMFEIGRYRDECIIRYDFWILHFQFARNRREEIRDLWISDEREEGSLFLRRGIKVAQVPWRLYHTYFYTEYFNNNNINICKGWAPGRGKGPCPKKEEKKKNTVRTHESLYTFPVLSRRSARARTPERLLYKTKTYIYIAARVA